MPKNNNMLANPKYRKLIVDKDVQNFLGTSGRVNFRTYPTSFRNRQIIEKRNNTSNSSINRERNENKSLIIKRWSILRERKMFTTILEPGEENEF